MNDSIWATVLGIAKTFGVTAEQALYEISYVNAIMYSRAMPMYGDGEDGTAKDERPPFDDTLDANEHPELFNDFEDEEVIRA